jgi:pantoate--beta-alanine ligase
MSSRNSYLNSEERTIAPVIYQTLNKAGREIAAGNSDFRGIEASCLEQLRARGLKPEYFSVRRSIDLDEAGEDDRDLSILTAAWLGSARLIDNLQVRVNDRA